MNPSHLPTEDPIIKNDKLGDDDNDSGDDSDAKPSRRSGRRKIKIEYIEDKNRRHITFSKRKAGIMKKAYELSTLTGTQVLLLVVSETGLVYTFTTVKLQPIVTKPEGKNLIQACLNAPDPAQADSNDNDSSYNPGNTSGTQSRLDIDKKPSYEDAKVEPAISQSTAAAAAAAPSGYPSNTAGNNGPYQQQPYGGAPTSAAAPSIPALGANAYGGHPNYMNSGYHPQQQQPPQQQQNQQPHQSPQQQQQPYGQMPGPGYYGNQQQVPPHYMQQQQQQHPGYWSNSPSSPALRQQEDDKARRGLPPTKK